MKPLRPLLSIVTITKNDMMGLRRTIESADAFRSDRVEQIIVSGDRFDPEIKLGFEKITNLRCFEREALGISDAFNRGLEVASGEWVWFVNGGDAVHESVDSEWLLRLLSSTRADAVFGAVHFDGEASPRHQPTLRYQWPLVVCWPMHPAAIVRRRVLVESGAFATRWRVAMDYDLWFRLLRRDVSTDIVSICFARFDTKGISERADTRRLATREAAAVLLKHSPQVISYLCWSCARTATKLVGALLIRLGLR